MKAVQIKDYGTPEVLTFTENRPVPVISDNQVLVNNYATGLNPHDI